MVFVVLGIMSGLSKVDVQLFSHHFRLSNMFVCAKFSVHKTFPLSGSPGARAGPSLSVGARARADFCISCQNLIY